MSKATGQTAYDALYDLIANGSLKPGDRLREIELAERIGLSRTPIREAIRRLEVEGIVSHEPRVGAVVKTLTQQEMVELYEMRTVLETTAATMAAKHCSPAEIRTLEALNEKMLAAVNVPEEVAEQNRQFHLCIVNAARNRYLAQLYRNMSNILVVLGATTLADPDRVNAVAAQHQSIIDALVKGDGEEAARQMSVHMDAALDQRLQALAR